MTEPETPPEISEHFPEELVHWIAYQTRRASDATLRRYRNNALVGFAILLFGIGYIVVDNRHRSIQGRNVLCRIIAAGDVQAYQYESEGTITKAQLERALEASASYREKLGGESKDCYPTTTPRPKSFPPSPVTPVGK